jgi:hypothetical protein
MAALAAAGAGSLHTLQLPTTASSWCYRRAGAIMIRHHAACCTPASCYTCHRSCHGLASLLHKDRGTCC